MPTATTLSFADRLNAAGVSPAKLMAPPLLVKQRTAYAWLRGENTPGRIVQERVVKVLKVP